MARFAAINGDALCNSAQSLARFIMLLLSRQSRSSV
jgi:hypothetical protein